MSTPAASQYTVLLVDDDQFLVDMYTTKFENAGYHVESATDGQKALETLRAGARPDVMLIDMVMPEVDGLSLLDSLHGVIDTDEVVLVALTNQGEAADREAAAERGVDEYILKADMVPSEVVSRVDALLGRGSTSSDT